VPTDTRIPLMQGLPPICSGFKVILSNTIFNLFFYKYN
jgi:hypothetical protein